MQLLRILNEAVLAQSPQNLGRQIAGTSDNLLHKLDQWQLSHRWPSIMLPHHHHLVATFFTTVLVCWHLRYTESRTGVFVEPTVKAANNLSEWVAKHHGAYGVSIIPPTFEFFVKNARENLEKVQAYVGNSHVAGHRVAGNLLNHLEDVSPTWPSLEIIKTSWQYERF